MRLESAEEKPGVQKVVETAPPNIKTTVSAVVTAKPVEATKPASAPATIAAAPAAAPIPNPSTNSTPALAAAPPKTALDLLKLQAIFYSSQDPKALINGQLASVDQEVSKCRVLDISPSSVTLEYLHQRRVLTLR
jgi:hypothetical protein